MQMPEIGTVMKDGTVYAGVSAQTGKMLFVMPNDASLLMNTKVAAGRLEAMNKGQELGHGDWRLPTLKELKMLFENKEKGALKGTFNERAEKNLRFNPIMGRVSPGWYRACDWGSAFATKGLFIKDGTEDHLLMIEASSVRFVREGEAPVAPSSAPAPYATPDITKIRQRRLNKLAQTNKLVIKFS